MSQQNESGRKSFAISEDLVAYRAVKNTTTAETVGYAAAGNFILGIVQRDGDYSDGDTPDVHLRSRPGTHKVTVDGAVSVNDALYSAASGKLSATQVGPPQMLALEAATADGDIIEAVFLPNGYDRKQFSIKTANYTVTRQESGAIFSNLGAAGAITFTLPQDAKKGDYFTFVVQTAQAIQVDPGAAGAVYVSGAKQADDKYVSFDDEAEHISVVADGNGDWVVFNTAGTLTVES